MKQILVGIAVVIVVILGAYLLVRPTNAPLTTPAVEVTPTEEATSTPVLESSPTATPELQGLLEEKVASPQATLPIAGVLRVTMANLKFSPSSLPIKSGKLYKLSLTSKGPHTYTVDTLGINFVIDTDGTKTFDLKVDKKGTYDVYCATPGHKEAGMVGKLIVQ